MKKLARTYAQQFKIIGLDKGLYPVFKTILTVAPYDINILLNGETGTGKDLLADFIHQLSRQKHGEIIKINCAALPDQLLESELFGYEKGAFTGAVTTKRGKIELAQNGTLFLDEIGEVRPQLQAKLLRVIQTKEISRIGSEHTRKINFRLITATNVNLPQAVESRKFRQDLYYRLSTFPIQVPPLRKRMQDLQDIIEHIQKKIHQETQMPKKKISSQAYTRLRNYDWPGNIRELENVLFQAQIYAQHQSCIDSTTIDNLLHENQHKQYIQLIEKLMQFMLREKLDLKTITRDLIFHLLQHFDNDIKQIQRETGLSKDKLYRYKKMCG